MSSELLEKSWAMMHKDEEMTDAFNEARDDPGDQGKKVLAHRLATDLPDEDALHDLRSRLKNAGHDVTDIIDHGAVRSVYFTDPTGIALEASWWVLDSTGRSADYSDDRFFADADPVPAVQELQTIGLTSVPSNRLS